MKVQGIRCLKCGTTRVSLYTHDFQRCQCGACFIDGGRSYTRIGGHPTDFEMVEIEVPDLPRATAMVKEEK
jgi:hypothetical protein